MSDMTLELLAELVGQPGPPGQEDAIRASVARQLDGLGLPHRTDAKGNLLTWVGEAEPERPVAVVTAHLDEIALMVTGADGDGALTVSPLGGVLPYKWGEGPVEVLGREPVPGVLSFGSIHTASPHAAVSHHRDGKAVGWGAARVITGYGPREISERGVRPGSRVVIARSRRFLQPLAGGLIGSYFLDDRADLLAWLLALRTLVSSPERRARYAGVLFAATASEEVGGEGALYLLHATRPDVCVALEIGPTTPDAPFPVDADPTVWVSDSYATMSPSDIALVETAAAGVGVGLHYQAVTRGGSDASCAASRGLCAHPVTLAFPAENSHGYEIMHRDAPGNLAALLLGYLYLRME
jgi:putative aminopeptidase FrvX